MLFHYILLPLTITLASAETSLDPRSPPYPMPPTRHPPRPPFVPLRPPTPSRSVLLSRASLRTEGIHSRNSLLRGLFCCNRCSRHSLVSLLPSSPSVSSVVFGRVRQTHRFANQSVNKAFPFFKLLFQPFPHSRVNYRQIDLYMCIRIYVCTKREREKC